MTTRFVFSRDNAHPPSVDFAVPDAQNNRPVLAFSSAASMTAYFEGYAASGLTTPLAASLLLFSEATTGGVQFDIAVEAVSASDATDLDAADSFDTVNAASMTVMATAGYLFSIPYTLTNNDSVAVGDQLRFRVSRNVAASPDSSSGSAFLYKFIVNDSA